MKRSAIFYVCFGDEKSGAAFESFIEVKYWFSFSGKLFQPLQELFRQAGGLNFKLIEFKRIV